jgi:hypothetical protein
MLAGLLSKGNIELIIMIPADGVGAEAVFCLL